MNLPFKAPSQHSNVLTADGALHERMGVDGVYARTALYEQVIEGLSAFVSDQREVGTEILRFPPVMSRDQLHKSGYLKSFPHLLGCVSCLHEDGARLQDVIAQLATGQDWTAALVVADLVLTPAACYPAYPIVAARGPVPARGLLLDVACECFRHEPSKLLDRLQSFRMREYVRIGTASEVTDFRTRWLERAASMADQLGLPYRIEQASDPFFGRGGKLMASSQVEQSLKFELLVPVRCAEEPTACMSFNYHRDHFGTTWGLRTAVGEVAHTGCVAFGMDRLALALFSLHGPEPLEWHSRIRRALRL